MRAIEQDAVKVLVQRLDLSGSISTKSIREATNELRTMKYRLPLGSFGKHDNDLKRTCALLEVIAREMEGRKIPMAKLARAAYMKEKEFIKFHQLVLNFRQTKRSHGTSVRRAGSLDHNTKCIAAGSSIPSLAIKLGSFVTDSGHVADRALKLFQQIFAYSKKLPNHNRFRHLRDIETHRATYEAACFLVAGTELTRSKNTSTSQIECLGDGMGLNKSKILHVSTTFTETEFTNVLRHVISLLGEVEDEASHGQVRHREYRCEHRANKTKRRKYDDVASHQAARREIPLSVAKSNLLGWEETSGRLPHSTNQSSPSQKKLEKLAYTTQFMLWRKETLAELHDGTQHESHDSLHNPNPHATNQELSLEKAARDVLLNRGLSMP